MFNLTPLSRYNTFMEFNIADSIKLLYPQYFRERFTENNCEFLVSVFKDSHHNYVIPKAEFSKDDYEQNKKILDSFKTEGLEFSYYVPKELENTFKNSSESNELNYDCTARYVYKYLDQGYEIAEHEIIRLSEANFDMFLKAAEACFPGWDNTAFTTWCLNCPEVEMLGVLIEGQIAAFAGYFSKPEHEHVLLMNDGTVPEFRRQGLHDYVIKRRINEVLSIKGAATFYADVDEGEASHLGFIKWGFENGPLFVVYN